MYLTNYHFYHSKNYLYSKPIKGLQGCGLEYRFGFNGKENDSEVDGQQDYGFRIYDKRLGRFKSVDPLTEDYPMITPYQFASNRPIDGIDFDGLEYIKYRSWLQDYNKGGVCAIFANVTANTVIAAVNGVTGMAIGTKRAAVYAYKLAVGKADLQSDARKLYNGVSSSVSNYLNKPTSEQLRLAGQFITSPESYGAAVGFLSLGGGRFAFGGSLSKVSESIIKTFSKGGTKLVSSAMLEEFPKSLTIGDPLGTFISPSAEIDALLSRGLTRIEIAKKLGIENPNFLKGDLIRVDISPEALKKINLRVTTGNEPGANNLFIRGGKTIGGVAEAVVDGIPKKLNGVSQTKVNTN